MMYRGTPIGGTAILALLAFATSAFAQTGVDKVTAQGGASFSERKAVQLTDGQMDKVTAGGGGQTVALFNHNSGVFGASGNPNSSAGPGFFLEPQGGPRAVSIAVHFVQSLP